MLHIVDLDGAATGCPKNLEILKEIIAKEIVRREMLSDIFYSIALGDSPRVVEERVANHKA